MAEASSPREVLLGKAVGWFAANGVGDTSLRLLASEIGTSHRMLLYHFGSREGLLAAVVESVERGERDELARLLATHDDPVEAGLAFWPHVEDAAATFAPLFFELAGHAMQGKPYAAGLRTWLTEGWTGVLAQGYVDAGLEEESAVRLAQHGLALARGLLFDLALGGDRDRADALMTEFAESVRATLRQ